MHDVFISYSTRDREQAYRIRSFLRENGIACWMAPESIPTGSNYTKEIPVAIRNCRIFLLILSENSQHSPWVLRELDGAVNNNKYILPYLLDDAPMVDEFQFLLTGCQWHPAWQEDAMNLLVTRIQSLLPPKEEPKVAEAPAIAPEAPVLQPEPQVIHPQPAADQVHCPACGSHNIQPGKNGRHSYTAGEGVRFLLAWLAGIVAFCPVFILVMCIMDAFDLFIKFDSMYRLDDFTDLGNSIFFLLSIASSVGIGMLCHRRIRSWICRIRAKQGFRASGMVCQDCRKKFRITVPAMTRFPWESALEPAIPQPGVAPVRCPACGTRSVMARKGGEGSWDSKEKWTFLPAWLAGAVSALLFVLPVDNLLKSIPLFVVSSTGRYATLNDFGTFMAFCCTLGAAYGVVRLVRIPLKEVIRRQRVRKHQKVCGFRCPDCRIQFRLAIDAELQFPQETEQPSGLRQGK